MNKNFPTRGQAFNPSIIPTNFEISFNKLTNRIYDNSLTCTEKRVLNYFSFLCKKDGVSYASQKEIAKKVGLCVRHLYKIIKSLIKKGQQKS